MEVTEERCAMTAAAGTHTHTHTEHMQESGLALGESERTIIEQFTHSLLFLFKRKHKTQLATDCVRSI